MNPVKRIYLSVHSRVEFAQIVRYRNKLNKNAFSSVLAAVQKIDQCSEFLDVDVDQIVENDDKKEVLLITFSIYKRFFTKKTRDLSAILWNHHYRLVDIGFWNPTLKKKSIKTLSFIFVKDGSKIDNVLFPFIPVK